MSLDDRLSHALSGAYRSTFGDAPATLPPSARGNAVAITAGVGAVAVLAAAVAVPLALHQTRSGTSTLHPGARAVLQTGSPSETPVCSAADISVKAVLNRTTFTSSEFLHAVPGEPLGTLVATSLITGISATPCRSFEEFGAVGFVSPSGVYQDFNGPDCGGSPTTYRHNRTGVEPVIDPLVAPPCKTEVATSPTTGVTTRAGVVPALASPVPSALSTSALPTRAPVAPSPIPASAAPNAPATVSLPNGVTVPIASALPTNALPAVPVGTGVPSESAADKQRDIDAENDYGILLGSAGTIDAPADGLGTAAYNHKLDAVRAGHVSPAPVYRSIIGAYGDDPVIPGAAGKELGTWKLRITYGNITVETPFQVTAG